VRVSEAESYFMPVVFGPIRPHPAGTFTDVFRLGTVYETDRDAMAALLPEPFEPADDPYVSVWGVRYRGVNFLAGGGYNAVGVNLAVVFNGKSETLYGQFPVVIWENHMTPVIRGRELLGLPKLLADIPDPVEDDDRVAFHVTEDAASLVSFSVFDVRALDDLHELEEQAREPWFAWRYYPAVNGVGSVFSRPQLVNNEADLSAGWECTGEIEYGDAGAFRNPVTKDIVAGLHTLPVREYVRAFRTQGTSAHIRAKHQLLEV
jgi:acetoacetate decarboxylase